MDNYPSSVALAGVLGGATNRRNWLAPDFARSGEYRLGGEPVALALQSAGGRCGGEHMLQMYACRDGQLAPASADDAGAIWYDLLNPTLEEDKFVEKRLGVSIPTKGEMEEIELSARLYQENGAEFMTVTAVLNLNSDEPIKTPVTFVLKGTALVTVRYAEPKAFPAFAARAQRPDAACPSGEDAMLGLIDAMIDRIADALERASNEVDGLSRMSFAGRPG